MPTLYLVVMQGRNLKKEAPFRSPFRVSCACQPEMSIFPPTAGFTEFSIILIIAAPIASWLSSVLDSIAVPTALLAFAADIADATLRMVPVGSAIEPIAPIIAIPPFESTSAIRML